MTPEKRNVGQKAVGGPAALIAVMVVLIGGVWLALQYIAGGGRVPAWMEPRTRAARAAPTPTTLEGMGWGVALVKCEAAARQQLKDPESARFPNSGQPAFNGTRWNHAGEVSGTNGFGALVQTSYLCEITGTTQQDAVATVQLLQ